MPITTCAWGLGASGLTVCRSQTIIRMPTASGGTRHHLFFDYALLAPLGELLCIRCRLFDLWDDGRRILGSIILIMLAAVLPTVLVLWLYGERWGPMGRSTWAMIRESGLRRLLNLSAVHGYFYGRWLKELLEAQAGAAD